MINLLPPDLQTTLGYARLDTKLRRLASGLTVLLVAIVVTFIGGLLYLKQTSKSLNKQLDAGRSQLAVQDQAKIKQQVDDLSGTLKLVEQVLSKEVLFSKLLKQIGSVMPAGSVLTALSINQISGGLDLQ